ncbi:hypothetical protein METP3_03359 [Methanosarcinales archaeon]|nr:hypothetical protein METP3_03359 [Methanosarcinales archaeon]
MADLNTNWQEFTTEFTTSGFSSNVTDGRLQFYLVPFAKAGDTYYIDNVILEKAIDTPQIPPAVIGKTPSGTNVPVTSRISLNFSKPMNQASAQSAFSISPNVTGSFSWNGNNMTFIPDSSLSYGTIYKVTIGSGAMDLAGNKMPSYTWQFTTTLSTSINLIKNLGFESGRTSWSFYTNVLGGTFSAVTPGYEGNLSARIVLSKIGTNMQLYQSAINLEPNTRYKLSFFGKSSYGHDIRVKLIKSSTPYTLYGLDYQENLNSDWTCSQKNL